MKGPGAKMEQARVVLKLGGTELDNPAFVARLTEVLAAWSAEGTAPPVIVHGGGKEIAHLQLALGLKPSYVDGLRVTDMASLEAVTMVLCGAVNKRLVGALTMVGIDALGLSGVDRELVRVEKLDHPKGDLGRVGTPVSVRAEVLEALLDEGVAPVIAPVCLGPDGPYNVNADQVAGAVASALGATLLLLTDVPGVEVEGRTVESLSADEVQSLIASGVITDGMLPKVRSALAALAAGAPSARILALDGLQSGGGTRLVA